MAAEIANHALALVHAILPVAFSKHYSCARLVQRVLKREFDGSNVPVLCQLRRAPASSWQSDHVSGAAKPADSPAREHASDLLHVLLCVSAIHAERVQFEQLARVVLVESTRATLATRE